MNFKHLFVSATKDKKEDTLFYKCHNINQSFNKLKQIIIENNTNGLSEVYNKILKKYKNEYDYIHFVHDDVFIYDDMNVIENLLLNNDSDIYGVAGASKINISYPSLWHIMGKNHSFGSVEHKHNTRIDNLNQPNHYNVIFGPCIGDVVILDGVYLCVKTKNIKNWKFNENFEFHHYDIASCIDAFKNNLKLKVIPIHIRHEPDLYDPTKNKNWIESNNKFLKLYAK